MQPARPPDSGFIEKSFGFSGEEKLSALEDLIGTVCPYPVLAELVARDCYEEAGSLEQVLRMDPSDVYRIVQSRGGEGREEIADAIYDLLKGMPAYLEEMLLPAPDGITVNSEKLLTCVRDLYQPGSDRSLAILFLDRQNRIIKRENLSFQEDTTVPLIMKTALECDATAILSALSVLQGTGADRNKGQAFFGRMKRAATLVSMTCHDHYLVWRAPTESRSEEFRMYSCNSRRLFIRARKDEAADGLRDMQAMEIGKGVPCIVPAISERRSGAGDEVYDSAFHRAADLLGAERLEGRPLPDCRDDFMKYLTGRHGSASSERAEVYFLDAQDKLLAGGIQWVGSIDHTPLYPREVVKQAFNHNAHSVVIVHNHPSGNAFPSGEDQRVTRVISSALQECGMTLHDHFIVGRGGGLKGVSSFRDMELL